MNVGGPVSVAGRDVMEVQPRGQDRQVWRDESGALQVSHKLGAGSMRWVEKQERRAREAGLTNVRADLRQSEGDLPSPPFPAPDNPMLEYLYEMAIAHI